MILNINLEKDSYDIVIERNGLNKAKDYFDLNRKVLIVSDDGVPNSYIQTLLSQCNNGYSLILKQGEENKNIKNYSLILEKLCDYNFNRHDCVIALGGGVIGDMAGFASSTYMRGIDFYNIPTTSLSQIDSSIGGKTAIDFNGLKNIVGSFYQPKKVIVDIELLKTLDHRQLINGLIEGLKMGFIYDPILVSYFENDQYLDHVEDIIVASLKAKKYFVENDVKEKGIRKALNFGHTIGHGIEVNSDLVHGEAVALGMLSMCNDMIRSQLIDIYTRLGIKRSIDSDIDKIIQSILHDKKSTSNGIDCVIVNKVGTFEIVNKTIDEIKDCLRYCVKENA